MNKRHLCVQIVNKTLQVVANSHIRQGERSSSLVTVVPWPPPGALVPTRLHRWCPVMLLTIPHSLLKTSPPLLLLALVPLFLLPSPVNSHARLMEPPSRASMWRLGFDNPPDFNDHQVSNSKAKKVNEKKIFYH